MREWVVGESCAVCVVSKWGWDGMGWDGWGCDVEVGTGVVVCLYGDRLEKGQVVAGVE